MDLVITIAVWVYEGKSISNLYLGAIRKKKGGFWVWVWELEKKICVGWIDLGDHLQKENLSYSLIVLGFVNRLVFQWPLYIVLEGICSAYHSLIISLTYLCAYRIFDVDIILYCFYH